MCPLTNLRAVPLVMPTPLTAFASERAHTRIMASSEVGSSDNVKQVLESSTSETPNARHF